MINLSYISILPTYKRVISFPTYKKYYHYLEIDSVTFLSCPMASPKLYAHTANYSKVRMSLSKSKTVIIDSGSCCTSVNARGMTYPLGLS